MPLDFPIILASGSPRRRAFLEMLNLPFSIETSDIDETPFPAEPSLDLVQRLSQEKAKVVAKNNPTSLIIAADTIVVLGNRILGKPRDEADARQMLRDLRGRDHLVCTAVTLCREASDQAATCLNQNTVTMRPYTNAEIEAYLATGDPMDKAGAYAIQHPEFAPVAKFVGCYAGVVGLPLGHLAEGLAQFGLEINRLGQQCTAFTGQPCCQLSQA